MTEPNQSTEEYMMSAVRNIFSAVVKARLDLLQINKWLAAQSVEFDAAAEDLDEALNALYDAEDAVNDLHKQLMTAQVISILAKN